MMRERGDTARKVWFYVGLPGVEKSTRPLVFASESSIRASGNLPWLARQDE